jgi:molecular chaperone DnaK (HSP70)
MKISRQKYEELCMEKWKEMFPAVDRAIEIAKINKKDLNYIIFVGGPTRTPKIEEMVKEHFPNIEILKNVNVEEVVAYGAAISKKENLIIEDTISKSFGIAIGNKEFSEIIPMGTNLPTTGKSEIYSKDYTLEKGANTTQKIKVYEGTSKKAEENEYLGEFDVNLEEDEKKINN